MSGIINWDESLATGIKTIDEQREQLINYTNNFENLAVYDRNGCFTACILDIHKRFLMYIKLEVRLMNAVNYPRAEEHIQEHKAILKGVKQLVLRTKNKEIFTNSLALSFMVDIFTNHMCKSDKDMAEFVRNSGFTNEQFLSLRDR